ncbi:MAG: phage tail length tape measure family protein [Rubrivivax sp.]|nr:phage tail length tape measure family protein [Rubrivivax sp.]
MTTQDIKIRIGLEGAQQVKASAEQAGAALAKIGGAGEISAKQTAAAFRVLPAQLSDIAVQLQGGTNPLTVLLQQGSQIKDSFGGVGNTLKAFAAAINPVYLAVGAAAAVVGTLVLAYAKGAKEADEYRKAIVLTGNAAGTTVGQLNAMAASIAQGVGTQAKAAEVLAQLTASAGVSAGNIQLLAEAAIRLEREGGPAVEKTVAAFASLGKEPLQAAIRLNETTGFLTVSVYEQIKALEKQGNTAQAAAVAQRAYAQTAIDNARELEGGLGTLQRAWRDVGDAAKSAWDKILNIGRKDTIHDQVAALQRGIDSLQQEQAGGVSSARFAALDAEIAKRRERQSLLQSEIRTEQLAAGVKAAGVKAVRDRIEADKDAAKASKALDGTYATLAAEITKTIALNSIRAESGGQLSKAQELEIQLNTRLTEAVGKLTTKEQDHIRALITHAVASAASAEAAEREYKAAQETAKARASSRAAEDKGIDDYLDKLERERQSTLDSVKTRIQGLQDEEAAQKLAAATNTSLAGAIEQVTIARLNKKLARTTEGSDAYTAIEREIEARRELAQLLNEESAREASVKAAEDAARAWEKTVDDIRSGLTDALRRAFESGEDFGTAFAKTIGNELKTQIASALAGLLTNSVIQLVIGGGNGTSSALQSASLLNSLYGLSSGGGLAGSVLNSSLVTSAAASPYAYGAAIGTANVGAGSQAAMLAAQTGEFGLGGTVATSQAAAGAGSGAAASLGAYAGYAALIYAAAKFGSSLYNKGFTGSDQVQGKGWYEYTPENFQTKTLKAIGLSDKWSEILGGSVRLNHMFGRAAPRVDEQGFQGSFGAGDFNGTGYADITEKGGLFRSDKKYTETSALSDEMGRYLDDAAKAVMGKAKLYGEALGLPVDALANVSTQIKVAFGDDEAKNQEELAKAIGSYGDALVAGYADALKPLTIYGETTVQTIERVGGAIAGVNDVLKSIGLTALQSSIDGGRAALQLEAAFGGLGTLQQAAGTYLQNYFSEAERANLVTGKITETLADFGLSLPKTREELRAMVEAQDLTTEQGARAAAVLLGVSDAFAQITPAARSAASVLSEQAGLQKELLQVQGDTAALRALERDALDESNRALYDQIRALEDQKTAADEATQAADEATQAAEKQAAAMASLLSAIDSNIGRFQTPQQQIEYGYRQASSTLAGVGLTASPQALASTTLAQVAAFVTAFVDLSDVSTEAKIAVVEVAGALADLAGRAAQIQAQAIQSQLDAITAEYGDVVGALAPPTEKLADAFTRGAAEIKSLEDGLNSLIGNTARSVQEVLSDMLRDQKSLQAFRSGSLADAIDSARLSTLTPQGRIGALKAREATLFAQLGSAADPVSIAQKLQGVIVDRLKEEAALSAKSYTDQISSLERLRDLSAEISQFTGSLKFSELSPLSFDQQLASARSLFESTLAGAQGGDATAQGNLTGNARAYLDEARAYFASSADYAAIFAQVTGSLDALGAAGANVDPQITALQALQAEVANNGGEQLSALLAIDSALSSREASNQQAIDKQIDLATKQITEAKATNDILKAQIAQMAAAVKALTDRLDRIGDNTQAIVDTSGDALLLGAGNG